MKMKELLLFVVMMLGMLSVHVSAFSIAALPGGLHALGRARAAPSQRAPVMVKSARESGNMGGGLVIGRRDVLVGFSVLPALLLSKPTRAAEDGENVVAQGEMRLEVGSEKKLEKIGGKATAVVTLRCVGKGIISETKQEVDLKDFPPPGRPTKEGQGSGVPFVVKVKDLREKTEKGRIVNTALYVDDDIFVRVDIKGPKDKTILSGLGKAAYQADGSRKKSLVLLE